MKIKDQEGKLVDAEQIEILKAEEPWSAYSLADGTVLKVKFVMGTAYRIKGQCNQDGEPLYVTKSQAVVMAVVPDDLKREAQG